MKGNFEDYPPEFDLSLQDLRRYRIIPIWAAFHDPTLRDKLFREWRASHRAFPAWVSQKVYAQRRAKHHPSSYVEPERKARQDWRELYEGELSAKPQLAKALPGTGRLGEAFQIAGLSNQEQAVMRLFCDGIEPSEIARQLGLSWGSYANVRSRALLKLKTAFVVVPGFIDAGEPQNH